LSPDFGDRVGIARQRDPDNPSVILSRARPQRFTEITESDPRGRTQWRSRRQNPASEQSKSRASTTSFVSGLTSVVPKLQALPGSALSKMSRAERRLPRSILRDARAPRGALAGSNPRSSFSQNGNAREPHWRLRAILPNARLSLFGNRTVPRPHPPSLRVRPLRARLRRSCAGPAPLPLLILRSQIVISSHDGRHRQHSCPPLPRTRPLHPADEAEKHAKTLHGRRPHHPFGAGVLRLIRRHSEMSRAAAESKNPRGVRFPLTNLPGPS